MEKTNGQVGPVESSVLKWPHNKAEMRFLRTVLYLDNKKLWPWPQKSLVLAWRMTGLSLGLENYFLALALALLASNPFLQKSHNSHKVKYPTTNQNTNTKLNVCQTDLDVLKASLLLLMLSHLTRHYLVTLVLSFQTIDESYLISLRSTAHSKHQLASYSIIHTSIIQIQPGLNLMNSKNRFCQR